MATPAKKAAPKKKAATKKKATSKSKAPVSSKPLTKEEALAILKEQPAFAEAAREFLKDEINKPAPKEQEAAKESVRYRSGEPR